jgi:flagellar basal-body rod protein FlgF
MPYGMYISAEGAQAQAMRMEVIANNLANVDTAGFKGDVITFRSRFAEAIEEGLADAGDGSIDDIGGGVTIESVRTDFSPGPLRQTDIDTDFAVAGDGFFAVQKDGATHLMRAGNFKLTSAGQLVTQEGATVLNDSGGPIVIDSDLGPWQLAQDGTITQAGTMVSLLGLRKPVSLGDLAKVGENLFRPLAETVPVSATERNVMQGYLEGSAINPTREMVAMIKTSRAFEANTRLIQHQDQLISALVNRVLRG